MLGNIQIFFGKVVDISDELKINRVRVSIDGLTDEIKTEDLPWYFPWYGLSYLPILNDVVPIIVFDGNMSTCFYNRKVDLKTSELIEDDYINYLEIYKRTIDDKNISLTYKKTTGIEFINDKEKIQIELDKISLFSGKNSIVVTDDRIDIGNEKQEATILGDKGVALLQDIIKHQANMYTEMYTLFSTIQKACVTPFTAPIKAALLPLIPVSKEKIKLENKKVEETTKTIQSKKTYIQ